MCAEVGRSGRALGPKGQGTRQRLLEVLKGQLEKGGARSLRVTRIAREAGASPTTFYQYFDGIDAALRELALSTSEAEAALAALDAPWRGGRAHELARTLVSEYVGHWERHGAVLAVRNAAAEAGDRTLAAAREQSLSSLLAGLEARLQDRGVRPDGLDPDALAAVLAGMLESLASNRQLWTERGLGRGALVEACAHVLAQALAPGEPPGS